MFVSELLYWLLITSNITFSLLNSFIFIWILALKALYILYKTRVNFIYEILLKISKVVTEQHIIHTTKRNEYKNTSDLMKYGAVFLPIYAIPWLIVRYACTITGAVVAATTIHMVPL